MKIRISIPSRFSLENIRFRGTLLCLSSYALLEHVSVSIAAFSPVKYILLYIAGGCCIFEVPRVFNNVRKKKYFYSAVRLFLMIFALLASAYANRNPVVGSSPVYGTVRLILYLLELFVLVVWTAETGRVHYLVRFLFKYLLILVLLTDFLLLTELLTFSSGNHATYLVGTKFSVTYRHMELMMLWILCRRERYQQLQSKKYLIILMTIIIALLSYRIDCMTGIVGVAVFFALYTFVDKKKQNGIQLLSNPTVFVISILCSVVIIFVIELIVTNPIVAYIINNVLQRDTTLTGRVFIFDMFSKKMSGNWLFGFGFGNGNAAAKWLFGYANAQNALLHWILQAGLLATSVLVFWMCGIFKQLNGSERVRELTPIIVLVYVFIVLGIIETTFNMAFVFWLALIWMYISENRTHAQKGQCVV